MHQEIVISKGNENLRTKNNQSESTKCKWLTSIKGDLTACGLCNETWNYGPDIVALEGVALA